MEQSGQEEKPGSGRPESPAAASWGAGVALCLAPQGQSLPTGHKMQG